MEENEKFEKFAEALREYTDKVNKIALENGDDEKIPTYVVEILIDELKYYLENQDKIRDELQEPLEAYEKLLDAENNGFYAWANVDGNYGTLYVGDELLKEIRHDGNISICYTYDGLYLSFSIWKMQPTIEELATIAVDDDLQFENEKELKDLVVDVVNALELR